MVVNDTLINLTLSATQILDVTSTSQPFFTVVLPEMLSRYFVFLAAPFLYPEMWWLLIHLLLTFVLFEFYFERHEDEELGWSSALANSIVAIFISMELLRAMYHHEGTPFAVLVQVFRDFVTPGLGDKITILSLVILLGLLGLATAIINYFHILPRKIAFLISGHKFVNLLAYFLIVVVWRYTHQAPLPVDGLTMCALLLFGFTMWLMLFTINQKLAKPKPKGFRMRFF